LAGKVVGKCIFETAAGDETKQLVNSSFSRSFLGQIIGFTPHLKYFQSDDPELYIGKVKYVLENDVATMDLNFTDEEYLDGVLVRTVDLIPNGSNIPVTNDNKEDYLNALANYRLGARVEEEIRSFVKGLNEIIPDTLLSNFSENELELLICGNSHFDIEDLKNNHVIGPDSNTANIHQTLKWFWRSIENMSDAEKGNLLQFTTGSSLLPYGGFQELRPPFKITLTRSSGRLPTAHTCFNEISLAMHSSFEEFDKALKTAINEGREEFSFA